MGIGDGNIVKVTGIRRRFYGEPVQEYLDLVGKLCKFSGNAYFGFDLYPIGGKPFECYPADWFTLEKVSER